MKEKFQQALDFYQKGRLEKAKENFLEIIKYYPEHANSLHFLGIISYQEKNPQLAVTFYHRAIEENPNNASFHSNLGVVLKDLEQFSQAVISYDKAIKINPDNADFYYNRGNVLRELEEFESALISYDKAIAINPNNIYYHYSRGNIMGDLKKFELAVTCYDDANHLGNYHESYANRGNALFELKKVDAAIASHHKALELKPDYASSYFDLGRIMYKTKQLSSAAGYYQKAIQLKPDYVDAYVKLGHVLYESRQLDAAIANYKKATQLKPDYDFLLGTSFYARNEICDWSSYDEDSFRLKNDLQKGEKVSFPFPVLSLIDSPNLQLSAATIFSDASHTAKNVLGEIAKISQGKKIRIGYYSSDFRNHAVAYLIANLFESHDKSKFELIAFSFGPRNNDDIRNRIAASFDQFIDVESQDDEYVTNLSRELEIDIAVDLNGFTQYARIGIFAQRCAPIQVNYLGYPGTSGAPYIDYIIADKILIPEESQKYYSEKIVYLPNTYQVNDSKRKISSKTYSREDLGLPKEGFIYCCFNKNYKITPEIFSGWMRILKSVEGSVLWLLESNAIAMNNLHKEAEKRGIDSSRLIFAKRMPLDEHLARHKVADLFIDTVPYSAHTTCSDALWAGLPVLTLIGQSFASRVSASLLSAIELPELITSSYEEYEAKAIEIANNPEKLKAIKCKLAKNRLMTALFDINGFTNHIEQAYEAMYDAYHDDKLPSNIMVKK